MKEIHISDPKLIDEITALFKSNFSVAVFEFSGVYGLLAANSINGVNAINQVKNRLPNKYYSSIIGNSNILDNAVNTRISLNKEKILELFESSFIRFSVADSSINNSIVCKGSHQFLVKRPHVRELFSDLELNLSKEIEPSPFVDFPFFAPTCSSANISGSSEGGIKNKSEALQFVHEKKVPLFIHTGLNTQFQGSYPVFSIDENCKIKIERKGYNDELIFKKVSSQLK